MLPSFETDHRNGYHNGSPSSLCSLCKAEKVAVAIMRSDLPSAADIRASFNSVPETDPRMVGV